MSVDALAVAEARRRAAARRELAGLELAVTRRLDGLLRGRHTGLLPGPGAELAGSREYRPGEDDARRMDWAVTARTTVPHVRQTVADHELTVRLVVDASASMDFGTASTEKRHLAAAAVAAVGFLTAGAGNRLGADVVGPAGTWRLPARAGREHLMALLTRLTGLPRADDPAVAGRPGADRPSGGGLAAAIAGARRALPRRGLAVVVSDFLDVAGDDDVPWAAELRRLAARHQVLAVEVLDPRELELPDVGMLTLVDPESGRSREVWTGDRRLRERYAAEAARHRSAVRSAIARAGAAHLVLRTDRDWVLDVVRHVHEQRRRAFAGPAR